MSRKVNGYKDGVVQSALALIAECNTTKTTQDQYNQIINNVLVESGRPIEPTSPRWIAAKRLTQGIRKTSARIKPLSWTLQGDETDEEDEIMITNALKEVLHRGNYDGSFTGKGGIIDKMLPYGDGYRLIYQNVESKFPVGFKVVDNNNIYISTKATSFRNGNKNVDRICIIFTGSARQFFAEFPKEKGRVTVGEIPRDFKYKDLDQTWQQRYATQGGVTQGTPDDLENEEAMEWGYYFDCSKKEYVCFAGSDCTVLEKKVGDEYDWTFTDYEGREVAYIPVTNYMCMPSYQGIYNIGLGGYLYDYTIVFRRTFNQMVSHVDQNAFPHTIINVPDGQEGQLFNLIENANIARMSGQNAYIPFTFTPGQQGGIANAQPILNGGDMGAAQQLMAIIDDEFRKCGVYLDEPIDPSVTATQIQFNASNALVLPKEIMKYNAPEVEFEVLVAIDMIKKYVKDGDETPLMLNAKVKLPDGEMAVPAQKKFTLGWLKAMLKKFNFRVVVDPESGANVNDVARMAMYQSILPQLPPDSEAAQAISKDLAFLTGVELPSPTPLVSAQQLEQQTAAPQEAFNPDMKAPVPQVV